MLKVAVIGGCALGLIIAEGLATVDVESYPFVYDHVDITLPLFEPNLEFIVFPKDSSENPWESLGTVYPRQGNIIYGIKCSWR